MADIRNKAYEDFKAGMSYPDIANKHNVSLSTIKSWASRHWRNKKVQPVQPHKKSATATSATAKNATARKPKRTKKNIADAPKNKVGCPPFYKTVDEMEIVIADYFETCKGQLLKDDDGELIFDKKGKPIWVGVKPPTITGLALHLGFNSRQALINYQNKPEFNYAVTRAKARCEEYAEQQLYTRDGARGAEFTLSRNFKWKDPSKEREIDLKEREVDLKEQAVSGEDMGATVQGTKDILIKVREIAPRANEDNDAND